MDDHDAVVIDNGSRLCKVGFGGEESPRTVFPSAIGRAIDSGLESTKIGNAAQKSRGILTLRYPVERGVVANWDDMEAVWRHAYEQELHSSPDGHPALVTEPPHNPTRNREKMAEVFFESLGAPGFRTEVPALLAMFASGRGTGIVLDVGDGVTHVVPLCMGYTFPHAIARVNFAGRDVTDNLAKMLAERGEAAVSKLGGREFVNEAKENACYVALDYAREQHSPAQLLTQTCELPDGKVVTLGRERFHAPEPLFQPALLGLDTPSLAAIVAGAIAKCDMDTRRMLYSNIVVSGGTTQLPGLVERLEKEVALLAPPAAKVKVVAAPDRHLLPWIGGSIVASLSTFRWIPKSEYDEVGPSAVRKVSQCAALLK